MAEPSRPRAQDIYERVVEDAGAELERSGTSLASSALFAGFTIGATPLVVALTLGLLDSEGETLIAALLYPIGYAAVILGRAQFFTENTLYPVILSFQDRSALAGTARLWAIVYGANVAGAFLFALMLVGADFLGDAAHAEFVQFGGEAAAGPFSDNFWSAVITGWLLATVAWLVEATETAIGQLVAIWALTLIVGLGSFDHCIASTINVAAATMDGELGLDRLLGWLGTVTLGNIAGGVLIVSMLNYGQARYEEEER
jgi:formate/nitrite transporter FocA (FNT family)